MQRIKTGTEPTDRLLDVIVAKGLELVRGQANAWLAGELTLFLPYAFLAQQGGIAREQVPTVLNYLDIAGFIKFDPMLIEHGAYIRLRLPAEARVA